MAAVPLHYLELRAFCYATEDESKVREALETVGSSAMEFEREVTEGHYGDRIVILSTTIESTDEITSVLEGLTAVPGFDRVITGLPEYVDEDCTFFLRLDKQRAFQGELRLGEGIHVRGKIEAYPAKREAAITNLREALLELVEAE